ncbi:MAG: hypothetical protein LC776_20055 [Acidobacteria bacterium]|nr:hypothetical protein [Acidobacteriota bacterium]
MHYEEAKSAMFYEQFSRHLDSPYLSKVLFGPWQKEFTTEAGRAWGGGRWRVCLRRPNATSTDELDPLNRNVT